jgi:hypothetical protein
MGHQALTNLLVLVTGSTFECDNAAIRFGSKWLDLKDGTGNSQIFSCVSRAGPLKITTRADDTGPKGNTACNQLQRV